MLMSLIMKVPSLNSDLHTVCAENFFFLVSADKVWDIISNCETVPQIVRQNLYTSLSIHYLWNIALFDIWNTDKLVRQNTQNEQIII